jgi:hypothetical protein
VILDDHHLAVFWQSIQTHFSQPSNEHPDVMQASIESIRKLHLNLQQSESKLPTAFVTGCSSAKSWLNPETWLDDRVGPCQHISFDSLVPQSQIMIFIAGITTSIGKQQQHSPTCFVGSNFLFCNLTT